MQILDIYLFIYTLKRICRICFIYLFLKKEIHLNINIWNVFVYFIYKNIFSKFT